jgi:diguanylate cyclase (GGDEF)-like protein
MAQATIINGWESDQSHISSRRMTAAYMLALLLIALLSASMHYLLNQGVRQQEDAATIVNIAGRQRMLSQRIALLAEDFDAGIESARTDLLDAVNLMERSQNALINHNDLGISSNLSTNASYYYFEGNAPLDQSVRKFIEDTRQFLAAKPGPERHQIQAALHQTALNDLLPSLDRSVSIFESEANERVASTLLMQKIVFISLLMTLTAEALLIFRPIISTVRENANQLYILATHDGLTNLPNRRLFSDTAERLVHLAKRNATQNLAALMIDIDNFKKINDAKGHAAGDAVLKRFADIIRDTLRTTDVFGRVGGEEFALVLPDTNLEGALRVAEKLRKTVEKDFSIKNPHFTISIGVTPLMPSDSNMSDLMHRSDEAMYFAKRQGRNCIGFISDIHPTIFELPSVAPDLGERKVTRATSSINN